MGSYSSNKSVTTKDGQLVESIRSIISTREDQADHKQPFHVLYLSVTKSLFNKWTHNLPMIHPFYAVKCNPNTTFLAALAALGCNFDCASRTEIEIVLSLGVSPDRIIYANPYKDECHIKYAASVGVNLTTFDSRDELEKIRKCHPKCGLLLRVNPPADSKALKPLGSKFGALAEEVMPLLKTAQALDLNVTGVSFHIGSGATDLGAYRVAIATAKGIFDSAEQLGMPKMTILDVGGGFNSLDSQFNNAVWVVKEALEAYFPNETGLTVISEPGRFFAESSFTLVANVIGKRIRNEVREYWINDGIYGSFSGIIHSNMKRNVTCMPLDDDDQVMCKRLCTYDTTIFGPTCDAIDTVLTDYQLPDLQVSDWLVFPNMGAYSTSSSSSFNGFVTAAIPTYIADVKYQSEEDYMSKSDAAQLTIKL